MSAFAADNRRSDYHWQCDTCYGEAVRRGDAGIYARAHARAAAA